jgi:hypothetical protein
MNLSAPPELADGGYWYVVRPDENPVARISTEGTPYNFGHSFWLTEVVGQKVKLVRCPDSLVKQTTVNCSVPEALVSLGLSVKPFSRVGGR